MAFIEGLWLEDNDITDELAIRVDWDNDRHQRIVIQKPHNSEMVILSLKELISQIENERKNNKI